MCFVAFLFPIHVCIFSLLLGLTNTLLYQVVLVFQVFFIFTSPPSVLPALIHADLVKWIWFVLGEKTDLVRVLSTVTSRHFQYPFLFLSFHLQFLMSILWLPDLLHI